MTPDLNQLMELINKQKEKQSVLDKVAAQPSQGQPWRRPEDTNSTWEYALGRGNTPGQSRALNQLYGSILNRPRTQSAIAAATGGFEKGSALIDDIRGKQKDERVNSAKIGVEGAQQALSNAADVYTLGEEAKQRKIDSQKMGTVTFNGEVWATDASGKPVYKLGASEGQMGRNDEERVRKENMAEEVRLQTIEDLKKVDTAADLGSAIQTDIDRIREGIDGWTTDKAGWVGQWLPGTDAYDQRLRIESLKSKLGLAKLKELRDAAKSGASGMGQLTEKELDRLESAIQKIDMGGSKEAQEIALRDIERYYQPALDAYANVFGVDKLTGKKVRVWNRETGAFE